ncbi:MAG: dihydroorotate dehydrogenase [Fidelibacterota bacterium]|nr:MAG: dihydroorotate dehydrogenase [Candidatus Neomarinimicrobiota bacterium]
MPSVDITVRLNDQLLLQNPILTASGTFGYGDDVPDLVDVNRLGGLVTKSITLHPREGHSPPRIAETPSGMLNAIGLANIGVDRFCDEKLAFLASLDTTVIVSIAGSSFAEYQEVMEIIEARQPGIAGYEINVSCPNVKEGGMEFGVSAQMTEGLTRTLRALTDRYLIIKLSPNVTTIADIAIAAEVGGADAVSAINTVVGMGIDPLTGKYQLSTGMGGLSGPAIRPIALAAVFKIAQVVHIPIIGIGGIMNIEDVVMFLRAGAHAVQIGTANYRDPGIGVHIARDLPSYLEQLGIQQLSEVRGTAIP